MCRRRLAAMTPVKYEYDSKNVTGTFARSKIFAYGEINERGFSNPHPYQGLYSLSGKASYRKISLSFEAARSESGLFRSLWNLTGTSAAVLPKTIVLTSHLVASRLHDIWR